MITSDYMQWLTYTTQLRGVPSMAKDAVLTCALNQMLAQCGVDWAFPVSALFAPINILTQEQFHAMNTCGAPQETCDVLSHQTQAWLLAYDPDSIPRNHHLTACDFPVPFAVAEACIREWVNRTHTALSVTPKEPWFRSSATCPEIQL